MAEIAAAAIAALIPIVGELDLAAFVAWNAEEDQREAPGLIVHSPPFFEPEQLEKCNVACRIGHSDHAVEEFHFASLSSSL